MKRIECAGGIVTNQNLHVLVIKNQIGKITLPKGTCEEGETTVDTALREIREESGLSRVEIVDHLGVLVRHGFTADNPHIPSVIKHIDMFYCTTDETELQPITKDVISAQWLPPDELCDILTWPEELAFFEQHREALNL